MNSPRPQVPHLNKRSGSNCKPAPPISTNFADKMSSNWRPFVTQGTCLCVLCLWGHFLFPPLYTFPSDRKLSRKVLKKFQQVSSPSPTPQLVAYVTKSVT